MLKSSLTPMASLLLVSLAFLAPADAQIEQVTFSLDPFCGAECFNKVKKVITFYYESQDNHPRVVRDEDVADMTVDRKRRQVVLHPGPLSHIDLYDLRQELRNANRSAQRGRGTSPNLQKIEVTVAGKVVDYIKTYSGGVINPQKALEVRGTGQLFLLHDGIQLRELLDFVEAGHEQVMLTGAVPGFREKHLPVLAIKEFKAAADARGVTRATTASTAHTPDEDS